MSMETIFAIVESMYFVHGVENINVSFEDGRYLIELEGEVISDELENALTIL